VLLNLDLEVDLLKVLFQAASICNELIAYNV
jgi:hypothetical protein